MCTCPSSKQVILRWLMASLALCALPGPTALGLPDDRLQSIEITADRAERNELAGFTLYRGTVVLVQGSLRIEADRLTIYHDREKADRIVALGEPARLQQRPAIDKELVVASAKEIVYQRSIEVVELKEAASIEQEGAIVRGESIRYFMAEQRVQADGTPDDDSSRVQVLIPAEVIEEAQQEVGGDGSEDRAGDEQEDGNGDPKGQ